MQIKYKVTVGNLKSGDLQVSISPNTVNGLDINIESQVMVPFGDAIRATVEKTLDDFSITNAWVKVTDKGALDWVIRSRMQIAICSSTGTSFDWEGVDE